MAGAEERKVKSLAELSRSIEPRRDLWPQIQAHLEAERTDTPATPAPAPRPRAGSLRWLAAAAMVASIGVGVFIGRDLLSVGSPRATPATAATQIPAVVSGGSALDASYVQDPRYRRERAALMQTLQARLDAMPAPARAKVAASLTAIEQAKQELELALGKDPSNALLQELLINTYQDEMRALTDVHAASDPGRGT